MKRYLLVFIAMMTISESVYAETIQNTICNNFKNIDLKNNALFLEKVSLLDDYKTYKTNGVSADKLKPIWENPKKYNIDIQNISVETFPSDIKDKFKTHISALTSEQKTFVLSKFISNLTNCPSEEIKNFTKELKQKLLDEEKAIYDKRTNGKSISEKTISIFTIANQKIKPSKDYIYRYGYSETQNSDIMLKVVQTLSDGVLVRADIPYHLWQYYRLSADKNILIKTTKNYVDEDILENGYYEYVGVTSYTNIIGSKSTVHTFKEIKNPMENLYLYNGKK